MVTVGWREWAALPQFGVPRIRAKIDTGARTSALHVEAQWRIVEQGAPWVAFKLRPHRRRARIVEAAAPICDERMVTDSGGNRSLRLFVRTMLALAGDTREIDINLTDRREMLFPLLIGRSALGGHCAVDPARSFIHGRIQRAPPAAASA